MHKICYVFTVPVSVRAFFISQLKYLAEHGYNVTVICSMDEDLQKEVGNGVKYVPVSIPRGLSLWGTVTAIKDLWRVFRKEQYDLVQYSTPNAAFCAAIASKLAGIKRRNYHLMGFRYLSESGLRRRILKILERITCKLSTSVECVSPSNLELGKKENVLTGLDATVIWHGSSGGVDLNRFDFQKRQIWRKALRAELGYSDDAFVFGFVGRITKDKGVQELLEAFFDVSDSKLLLVGNIEDDGSIDPVLWAKAVKEDSVLVHPFVPDVERYFAVIDALVLPSYREGFGNVVIEAAAMGVPAIVSNIPGPIDAVLPDQTALIVPVQDSKLLCNAMMKMRYSGCCEEMGRAAVKYAQSHFDSRVINHKILERKRQLISR